MLVKVMTPARRKQLDLNQYSSELSDTQMAHSEWTEYIHTKCNSWVNAEGQSDSSECSGQLWISHGKRNFIQCWLCATSDHSF